MLWLPTIMAENSESKLKPTSNIPGADIPTYIKDRDDECPHLLGDFENFITSILEPHKNRILLRNKHAPHSDLMPTLNRLSHRLLKLVSLTTGQAHPSCPESVLRYHLLTSSQLDDLARYYHQIWPPTPETYQYPKIIIPWIGTEEQDTIDIETKRERIGRFIGLRRT
ncbi:conserved hypothetical protein [Talaromyces stipitatus ATCC 10500]|uniref:Uncharacterized protein n=1 Tax=Talaromyces stipitatus (strain ATCC 10500 / CBS 375.48 / QM 6759 / NRRL 1006) TaxID=441959 RepID=B8MUG8_TALSN|nr:uncharacterized protein TSTA_110200 [Talaromyces stipitatus ATCC 10500]EED11840.1 conserved hypothetical protein [Talaromyces stipitatus ATCC 10500]